MSRRGWLAVAVGLIWVGTLGWHVKRLHFRPLSALIAEGARTIPPGTAYYAVYLGDMRVGWAQTDVDTLPSASGFRLRDRLIIREALVPGGVPARVTIEAILGPTLSLREFRAEVEGIPGIRHAEGEVHGDTALEIRWRDTEGTRREVVRLENPLVLSAAWPLRLAAQPEIRAGERLRLPVFDPLAGGRRDLELTVLGRERRSYPDSMTAEGGLWVTAREDTVDAWHVEQEIAGLRLRSWIDEDGRVLEAVAPLGLRLERTAFELAFFGDSVPTELPGRPGRRRPPADPAGTDSELRP